MKKTLLLLLLLAPFFTFGQWTQTGSTIEGKSAYDKSGFSVSLSSDGNTVAIGSPYNNVETGQVRVFKFSSGNWDQVGSDINGESYGDLFGTAVSLSSDGNILAVGANKDDANGTDSGHARVYGWTGSNWDQIGSDLDGEAAEDWFGSSVSLNNEGTVLAVGTYLNDGNGTDSGHARVFGWTGSNWAQMGFDIDGKSKGAWLGSSVNLSNDGTILAIGASYMNGSGGAQVFKWTGSSWVQIGSDINGEVTGDRSGFSTSLSGDGTILAIGASKNDGNGTDSGHARVFEWTGSNWVQIGSDIDGEAADDNSGIALSLSENGNILAVGAWTNDGNGTDSGHVRVYENIAGVWTQVSSDIDGEAGNDRFGRAVSLNSDGSTLAVGAFINANNGYNSGSVRIFSNNSLLSVTSNSFGPQFNVFPNPSSGSTNIELGDLHKEVKVLVFNLLGKEVMHKTYNNTNKINLNTQQFSTGIYIVKVEADISVASLKLVIK